MTELNGKEVVERALSLGEAVHGSEREKAILKLIEGSLDREVKRVPVRTKVWEVKEFHVGKIPRGERTKIGLSDLAFTN